MIAGLLALLLFFSDATPAQAKVLETIPSSYVRVRVEFPEGGVPPGQLGKSLIYLDGPVLRWRGSWKHPKDIEEVAEPTSPVPELVVPVRLVVPGIYKLYDIDDRSTHHGELRPETYTPESRIFRLLLPVTSLKRSFRYEVLFHAGLKTKIDLVVEFDPPQGIVIRNGECIRQGVTMDLAVLRERDRVFQKPATPAKKGPEKPKEIDPDTIEPTLIYLFCATEPREVQTAIYAPLDRTWRKHGLAAKKVYQDQGLFFALPRPERGVIGPETVTEFELEKANGKQAIYELRYNPPYRPRLFSVNIMMGPGFHHYNETKRQLDVDEIAWSGRFSIGAKLLPEGLDAYWDIGGTIGVFAHGPSTIISDYMYWYMNARAGYVERVVPGNPEWSILTGWYWWRFYVNAEMYGLTNKLGGPQLFVQRRFQPVQGQGRAWWVNGRVAFLGDDDYPRNMNSYDLSFGGGVDVLWIDKRRPLSVTLDIQRLLFSRADTSMSLFNVILGASFPIY